MKLKLEFCILLVFGSSHIINLFVNESIEIVIFKLQLQHVLVWIARIIRINISVEFLLLIAKYLVK